MATSTMKSLLDLLRSMRFAVSILTVVAVASAIGSVLEQAQPTVVYVSNYGEYWAELFALSGLDDVYHAWWFFALLGFMAVSTGLGLIQHAPQMVHEMRTFREHKSLASLRKLPQHREWTGLSAQHGTGGALAERLTAWLRVRGFRYAPRVLDDGSLMLAARSGAARRLGYLLVHSAIVLICVGGLIDGNVVLRWQLLTGAVQTETRDFQSAQVPAASRLPADAGSFRATMSLVEGDTGNSAFLQFKNGYLLQELPFAVRLKAFRVEHYQNNGKPGDRPSDFASDIEIIDGSDVIPVTLRVNYPYTHKGVTLFQSGFADGGSAVRLRVRQPGAQAGQASQGGALELDGRIGASSPLLLGGQPYTIELTEWRANNVFRKDDGKDSTAKTPATAGLAGWFSTHAAGSALEDVGPSLALRLRDPQGQATDWLVYERAVQFEGASWRVLGRRDAAADKQAGEMRYLRVPLDGAGSTDSYVRVGDALARPQARRQAAAAVAATLGGDAALAQALEQTVQTLLATYAERGYQGVAALVRSSVPEAEQLRAGRFYADLIERAARELAPGVPADLLRRILSAHSDSIDAQMALLFEVADFKQVQASGLQVTKAPGAALVYLGCALLALGVCAMTFVRERRLWFVLSACRSTLLAAYTGNRDTPQLADEFARHMDDVQRLTVSDHPVRPAGLQRSLQPSLHSSTSQAQELDHHG